MKHHGAVVRQSGMVTEAPLVVDRLYITQDWKGYTEENHRAWRRLYSRMVPRWERFANERFLQGIAALSLDSGRIPRLDDVNRFLCPLTGFRARAVSGYVPAFVFFDCLRNRQFPTTVTIRPADRLDYLPEPDIFHDIAGHVPMHTDRAFADTLVRFGEIAHVAAERVAAIRDEQLRIARLTNILRAMARFFWFTIEFGLMRSGVGLRAYGSGLLSSFGELEYALVSPDVQHYPIRMEWVINQSFEIDHYQPLLFTVSGFDHLYSLVDELGHWLETGRLDNVAPGEPAIGEADLKSFLQRTVS